MILKGYSHFSGKRNSRKDTWIFRSNFFQKRMLYPCHILEYWLCHQEQMSCYWMLNSICTTFVLTAARQGMLHQCLTERYSTCWYWKAPLIIYRNKAGGDRSRLRLRFSSYSSNFSIHATASRFQANTHFSTFLCPHFHMF